MRDNAQAKRKIMLIRRQIEKTIEFLDEMRALEFMMVANRNQIVNVLTEMQTEFLEKWDRAKSRAH